MRALLTILVAAPAALAGRMLLAADAPAGGGEAAGELAALRTALVELRAENETLARELEARTSVLVAARAPADEDELGEGEIAAALGRWRAAHPEEAAAAGTPVHAPSAADVDFAKVPIEELVQALSREGLTNLERQALFQRLRESGRIDEYVAKIEELAAANPNDPDMQVALGNAYLQKLFGVGNTPEAGVWAYKSDAAFDRALEIDDHNWAARFTKAVSLSNWPAFLGRGPEAIENFELLIEQQNEVPKRPEFAMTYLFLGNLQQANGNRAEALAAWRAGLELFPDMEDLQQALAGSDGTRDAGR